MARHKSHLTTKTRLRIESLENRRVPTTLIPTTFADGGLGSGSLRDAVLRFTSPHIVDNERRQCLYLVWPWMLRVRLRANLPPLCGAMRGFLFI